MIFSSDFLKKVEKAGFFKHVSRKNSTFYQIFPKADVQMSTLPDKTFENDGSKVGLFSVVFLVKGLKSCPYSLNLSKNDGPNVRFTLFLHQKNVQKFRIFFKFLQKFLKKLNFLSIFIKNVRKVQLFSWHYLKSGVKKSNFQKIKCNRLYFCWIFCSIFIKNVL